MADSLNKIKTYNTLDLDNFEIRGARTGVNNSRSTGPLYTQGQFTPSKDIFGGMATLTNGDATVTGISFNAPFAGYDASALLNGDTFTVGSNTLKVDRYLTATSVLVQQAPTSTITSDATFHLIDREYLIEPDITVNTTPSTPLLAAFNNGDTTVTGFGTAWLTDVTSGDSIQPNSYQAYSIIRQVVSNTLLTLTQPFTGTDTTEYYMTKRWRLGRLDYQYVENNFTYTKNKAKWTYDTTTGSGLVAQDTFAPFKDGIQFKFSDALNPTSYPDLMDSNVVLNKTLTKSTENPLYQYSLPVVPNPEESFQLYIDDIPKDRFPNGNMDYVLHYWQTPTYQYPPPMAQRRIANVMPLQSVQNVILNPANTALGTILFTDSSGKPVPGIMPGSETILFNGIDQTAQQDYVLNLDAGVGYASQHNTNEAVVKYIAYAKPGLFDYGITFTLDSTEQQFTIPHKDTDQVLFEFESGRFKPADKDNPAVGEEYIIDYLVEGDFINDEGVTVTPGMTWFRTKQYPIKFQGVIVTKNGIIIDENVDYRISYLTGRVVLFSPLIRGDTINVSYSPLLSKRNGFIYENKTLYCKSYDVIIPVTNANPPEFTLTNSDLSSINLQILRIHNVTKNFDYNLTDYLLHSLLIHLQPAQSQATDLTDTILIDYKFENNSVEYTPVQYINFFIPAGSDFIAFVDQDVTSIFPADTFIRITDIESAGDYFFRVQSSSFDGEDTIVQLYGNVPADLNNPIIYVSDAPIQTFLTFPQTATNIASGNTNVYFPGVNLSRTFRVGQLLKLGDDYYSVSDTQYDQTNQQNIVTIAVQTFQDYTTASVLGNVSYSDCPLYYEGNTIISTTMDIIDDPQTPAMTLNYDGLVSITSDSTAFSVDFGMDQSSFLYATYPKVSQLASALTVIGLDVVDYTPDWTSSKIIPMQTTVVTQDSTTLVTILPELRLDATDTTQFTIAGGQLILNNPLIRSQRYDLDYLGRQPLDDTTVEFSASYFSIIPAKSKISASFKFDNLDQFYVQATSQRRFLDDVVIPLMNQEAIQQSGNVGQGGDVAGDPDMGNSSGGLTGDEYRRVDAIITCGIFKTIFDFFNTRIQTYADEMYAAIGWRLCNNNGLINSTDESCGTKSVSRFFPWADYTSFPPYKITPLTGQTTPYATLGSYQPPRMLTARAQFTQGSSTVICTTTSSYPTYWTKQLKAGDYIRPFDSTKDYRITTIGGDSQLTLDTTYAETSEEAPFAMTSAFPLYDDDGFMGGKITGTVSNGYGLVNSDNFIINIDGVDDTCSFTDPSFPFSLFFSLDKLTPDQVVDLLNGSFHRTKATYEWIQDPISAFGYRSVIVLRTENPYNKIIIKSDPTSTAQKLGFVPDTTAFGNLVDPTTRPPADPDLHPEYPYTLKEHSDLLSESTSITTLVNAAFPPVVIGGENYLNRLNFQADASNIKTQAADEFVMISGEMMQLNKEITALTTILKEPTMAGYGQALMAFNADTTYLADSSLAQNYDASFTNFQGQITAPKWILDIQPFPQAVVGRDSTEMGVPSFGPGITDIFGETTFFIHTDNSGIIDKRFLNTTVDGSSYVPRLFYHNNGEPVDGSWIGTWQGGPASNQYTTSINDATFLIDKTQFFMLYGISPFAYQVGPSSMTLYWFLDATHSKTYSFSTDPTIGALRADLNTLAGVTTASAGRDGSSSYTIIQKPFTPLVVGIPVSLDKTSLPMFSMYQDATSTQTYNYLVDSTSVVLKWNTSDSTVMLASYPTIGLLATYLDSFPGLTVVDSSAHDGSSSNVLLSTTPVQTLLPVGGSPGVTLYDQPYLLFTLTNDNVYSHQYKIDKSGISMQWDSSGKYYSYTSYPTISAMKTGINADIPGLDATGPSSTDSSQSVFKQVSSFTAITPDATIYGAFRGPLDAYLATMDSKLLLERSFFVDQSRMPETSTRLTFLLNRYIQIIGSITNEEHFRSTDGSTGNLYNWADNRFNRSNGCEARLKQIEKQIEMNQASLNVSKRFL